MGNGKISLYSKTENQLSDQRGYNFDIKIGGVNLNAPEDNIGPTIELFMNDESFVSGGITNENPTLLAKLYDENGINTASGIGHDIVAILDSNSNPDGIDFPIPGNDDARRSIDLYCNLIKETINSAKKAAPTENKKVENKIDCFSQMLKKQNNYSNRQLPLGLT